MATEKVRSVKFKVRAVAALPLVIACVLLGNIIYEKYQATQRLELSMELTRLDVKIGAYVHEIQKERGASAIYLASRGSLFESEKDSQRLLVDAKQLELTETFTSLDTSTYGDIFRAAWALAKVEMDKLTSIRKQIDDQTLTAKEGLCFYTHHNAIMLEVIQTVSELDTDQRTGLHRNAYVSFIWGKEHVGIERAVLCDAFAADVFKEGMYDWFQSLMTAQDVYFRAFQTVATKENIGLFTQVLSDPISLDVQRMRDIVIFKVRIATFKKILLTEHNDHIGLDGMVHDFKNYVLYYKPQSRQAFEHKYFELIETLDEIHRYSPVAFLELSFFSEVREMFQAYYDRLPMIGEMIEKGESPEAIVAAAAIDDQAIQACRKRLEGTRVACGFGVDSNYWFKAITAKINLLKGVEDVLAKSLSRQGKGLLDQARQVFIFAVLGAIFLVAIVFVLLMVIVKRISETFLENEEINKYLESATVRANAMATEQLVINQELLSISQTHQNLYQCHSLDEVANCITNVLAREFGAFFSRIWIKRPGDVCEECTLADHCESKQECLHLVSSSGKYPRIDGSHRRMPLGAFKIGLIAQEQKNIFSNDIANDERVRDQQWVAKHGLQAFAGFPLVKDGQTIGVMAMFSQKKLPDHMMDVLEILAKITSAAIANVEQIEALEERQMKLTHDAFHDQLTNLSNRALLLDRLECVIDKANRHQGGLYALLYLDLDRFKDINDSLGHPQGDALLIEVAKRLTSCVRSCDTVARMGGDEFAILLESIKDFSEAMQVAERIQEALSVPVRLAQKEVLVSTSIGITISATGQVTPAELLRDADTALYRAKDKGKNCFEMFDVTMHDQVQSRLDIEEGLRRAIQQEEFVLHYQPIVSLQTGRIQGFEALLRWDHPQEGLVYPDKFMPLAEETGLIVPLGQWISREACRQLKSWHDQFPQHDDLSMSINLSVKQLSSPGIVNEIESICEETGLLPSCLNLEITESLLMENIEYAVDVLSRLKLLGVKLDLDDFGTGYSSLNILHQLPFDRLKIDRSFVSHLTNDPKSAEMVRTITLLAQNLNLEIVAEGIETIEQLVRLRELQCDFGQGYYFSPPLAPKPAQELLVHDHQWCEQEVAL